MRILRDVQRPERAPERTTGECFASHSEATASKLFLSHWLRDRFWAFR